MKGRTLKRRSAHAQLNRMEHLWPDFRMTLRDRNRCIVWAGPLRGFQMRYHVEVSWEWSNTKATPRVYVLNPPIAPRPGTDFIDLPHLIYDKEFPERSALCLFDPDAREWNNTMLIADRIVPWASEWLHHYEFWHLDGIWRGANAPGPISVGELYRLEREGINGTGA